MPLGGGAAVPSVRAPATCRSAAGGAPTVSVGTLVAFTTLQSTLLTPLNALMRTGVQVQISLALFARIFEYLDLPVDIRERENPVELADVRGDVRFEGVGFAYDPGAPTLTDVTLHVPAGTTLAVVGATGSGKTTLGYLLARLHDADRGRDRGRVVEPGRHDELLRRRGRYAELIAADEPLALVA